MKTQKININQWIGIFTTKQPLQWYTQLYVLQFVDKIKIFVHRLKIRLKIYQDKLQESYKITVSVDAI